MMGARQQINTGRRGEKKAWRARWKVISKKEGKR